MTSIPEDAPPWAHSLFTGKDHLEAAVADLSGYLGRLMAMVAPLGPEVHQMRGLLEATALRVHRLDQEKELPLNQIAKLRREVRDLNQARKTNPGRPPSTPDESLTTGQREALGREEAEKLVAEANAKRDAAERIRELESALAISNKREEERSAEKKDAWKFWRAAVVALLSAVVAAYATYRLTRPDVSQTIEYTQPKGPNSGK